MRINKLNDIIGVVFLANTTIANSVNGLINRLRFDSCSMDIKIADASMRRLFRRRPNRISQV